MFKDSEGASEFRPGLGSKSVSVGIRKPVEENLREKRVEQENEGKYSL